MSNVARPPVTLDVGASISTDALALSLIEQQKEKVGVAYGYCGYCGAAISRATQWRAEKKGRVAQCRACYKKQIRAVSAQGQTVYLCAHCRAPLSGKAARSAKEAAKPTSRHFGRQISCRSPNCKRALKASRKTDPDSLKSRCNAAGISDTTVRHRIHKLGMTFAEAIKTANLSGRKTDPDSLKSRCKAAGISDSTVRYRIHKLGMTFEEAVARGSTTKARAAKAGRRDAASQDSHTHDSARPEKTSKADD